MRHVSTLSLSQDILSQIPKAGLETFCVSFHPTAFNIVVTSPLCQSNLDAASRTAGASITKMKENKLRIHAASCNNSDIAYVPLIVETIGGWDKVAVFHIKKMSKQAASRTPLPNPDIHTFQRLSILLQRALASAILSRAPARASYFWLLLLNFIKITPLAFLLND